MARFAAGVKTSAGTTTLPMMSVFSESVTDIQLVECGIFNTSSTAFDVKLARISSGPGTVGAGLVENCLDNPAVTSKAQAFTTHTAGAPTLTDIGYRASIAANSGVIFTFGGMGVEVAAAAGTANGLCIVPENGAGQASQAYFVWME